MFSFSFTRRALLLRSRPVVFFLAAVDYDRTASEESIARNQPSKKNFRKVRVLLTGVCRGGATEVVENKSRAISATRARELKNNNKKISRKPVWPLLLLL